MSNFIQVTPFMHVENLDRARPQCGPPNRPDSRKNLPRLKCLHLHAT